MVQSTPVLTVTPNVATAANAISISGLTGSDSFTVTRTPASGVSSSVRGMYQLATGGADTFAGTDFEAPLDASNAYQVTAYATSAVTLTASSNKGNTSTNVPANAVDGSMGTFWESVTGIVTNDYFKVDLGASRSITNVNVTQDSVEQFAQAALEYSVDNVTWSFFSSYSSTSISASMSGVNARYLRLRAMVSNAVAIKIFEFAVTAGTQTTVTSSIINATINVPDGTAWIKDLATPTHSVGGVQFVSAVTDVKRPGRQQKYNVIGRQNSVTISDVRGGREGSMTLICDTQAIMNSVITLLSTGAPLLFQATAADGWDDMYFVPGDISEIRPGVSTNPLKLITFEFTESDAPTGVFTTIPGNSYLQVINFGSYTNLIAQRATYLLVLQRPYGS
jgi:hypothetical protein